MEKIRIQLIKGDITLLEVDVMVNAANQALSGGGGVDGAIHRKGGPIIAKECSLIRMRQGGCKTGHAIYTSAGNLKAGHVVHTVGPIYDANDPERMQLLLSNCYVNSLKLAVKLGASTIAFPNISTGVYGFPKNEAANVAIRSVKQFLVSNKSIEKVIFICFDQENYDLYDQRIS